MGDKVKTEHYKKQNQSFDERMDHFKNKMYSTRKKNDLANHQLKDLKHQADRDRKEEQFIKPQIEGNDGYPAKKVPTREMELAKKNSL